MNGQSLRADHAPFLEKAFFFDACEDSYPLTDISGEVPAWLRGTYYINGPSRFERAGMKYRHWLDGDGMVCALRFDRECVRFTNRFVRTPKLADEEAAGKPVYRTFGTSFPGDQLRRGLMLEPPVNVSAYVFAGTLLAFGEQALPFELDPVTLETRGEYDFDGRLTNVTPFAAHPKFDPANGRMLNFGVSFSATQPMLNLFEFDARGALVHRKRYPLQLQYSNHDFAISPRYAVFYLSPLLMDFSRFWASNASVMEALSWEPERGSKILVMPRGAEKGVAFEVNASNGYCLHLINCFEKGQDFLVVDVLELEAPAYPEYQPVPDMFPTVTSCRPTRYVVHIPTQSVVERIAMVYDRGPDFPAHDRGLVGSPYSDFWMLGISATGLPGRKFFNQLAHGSWEKGEVNDIYQTEAGHYLGGEPLYVANPSDPREGVVISEYLDANRGSAEFRIFDAQHVSRGPIARLGLKHRIHLGFHTSFHPAA